MSAQHLLNATHRATFSELVSVLQGGAAADHGRVAVVDTIVSASAPGDATEPRAAMRGGGSDGWVSQRKRRRGAAVRKAEPTPPAQRTVSTMILTGWHWQKPGHNSMQQMS